MFTLFYMDSVTVTDSICLSVCLSVRPSVCPSICPSVRVCLSVCPSVRSLSVRLSVTLFKHKIKAVIFCFLSLCVNEFPVSSGLRRLQNRPLTTWWVRCQGVCLRRVLRRLAHWRPCSAPRHRLRLFCFSPHPRWVQHRHRREPDIFWWRHVGIWWMFVTATVCRCVLSHEALTCHVVGSPFRGARSSSSRRRRLQRSKVRRRSCQRNQRPNRSWRTGEKLKNRPIRF